MPVTAVQPPQSAGVKDFQRNIYGRYFAGASLAFERRQYLDTRTETPWRLAKPIDDQLQGYLESLEDGQEAATDVVRQAPRPMPGDTYASVRHFLQTGVIEEVLAIARDTSRPAHWRALGLSLCHARESQIRRVIKELIGDPDPLVRSTGITAASYHGLAEPAQLMEFLAQEHEAIRLSALRALGRLGFGGALPSVTKLISDENRNVEAAATLASLRLGDPGAIQHMLQRKDRRTRHYLLLGAIGTAAAAHLLSSRISSGETHPDAVRGLGLTGDLAHLPQLIGLLDDPVQEEVASESIHIMSGLGQRATISFEVPLSGAQLFDSEVEAIRKSEAGRPVVERQRDRMVVDKEEVEDWRRGVANGVHYRNGRPISPAELVSTIDSDVAMNWMRRSSILEMQIRYGIPGSVEMIASVADQERAIGELRARVERDSSCTPGDTYFAGQRIA